MSLWLALGTDRNREGKGTEGVEEGSDPGGGCVQHNLHPWRVLTESHQGLQEGGTGTQVWSSGLCGDTGRAQVFKPEPSRLGWATSPGHVPVPVCSVGLALPRPPHQVIAAQPNTMASVQEVR